MHSSQKPKNILVVDNDPFYCGELVSSILQAGYQASMAGGIEDALLLLRGPHRFDLVFLDVGSPDMSFHKLEPIMQEVRLITPVFTVATPSDKTFIIELFRNGHTDLIEAYMEKKMNGSMCRINSQMKTG